MPWVESGHNRYALELPGNKYLLKLGFTEAAGRRLPVPACQGMILISLQIVCFVKL